MNEPTAPSTITRRRLLGGAGIIGFGLVAAACASDSETATTTADTGPATSTVTTLPSGDLAVAQLAAGVEVLAVSTYRAALDAATAGALGEVPDAVAAFVATAMRHHQDHLDAWNGVITGAGGTAVTEPNATLKPVVDEAFGKVTDYGGAAELALQLEQIAAATYNNAQSVLTGRDAIQLAGSIQVVDAQHASILLYVLGEYPVPDAFAKVDLAAS